MMVTMVTARTALWACVCLLACRATASHVPPKMSATIRNLLRHYKIPVQERFNRQPVFSRELLATKMEAKELLMSAMLQTYEKLIQRMLKELPAPTPSPCPSSAPTCGGVGVGVGVRAELSVVLKLVQELRRFRFQDSDTLLEGLESFRHIQVDLTFDLQRRTLADPAPPPLQMDNMLIQSKALWELPWLYEEASSLAAEPRARRQGPAMRPGSFGTGSGSP
uniref:interferon gamma-like n=1 Tax=Doryrhamphus excisus TaxID=161450 RepID=UPI0025AE6003|nr:interferon gamma-like [Doryrhamphus excisus]